MSVWRDRKRLPFSTIFLTTDLKRRLIFSSPGCDFLSSLFNVFVTYQDLNKEKKPYLKTKQAYLEADVVQMTVYLVT